MSDRRTIAIVLIMVIALVGLVGAATYLTSTANSQYGTPYDRGPMGRQSSSWNHDHMMAQAGSMMSMRGGGMMSGMMGSGSTDDHHGTDGCPMGGH